MAQPAFTPASYVKSSDPRGYLDQLIDKYAAIYEVPVDLVRRVVKRESNFNPTAFNRGHYGLMQIKHATASGMGYQGSAKGLFDAETNLKYSVKYLRGAYMVAGGNHDRADRLYQTGYYYDAKRKGLLGRDRPWQGPLAPPPRCIARELSLTLIFGSSAVSCIGQACRLGALVVARSAVHSRDEAAPLTKGLRQLRTAAEKPRASSRP